MPIWLHAKPRPPRCSCCEPVIFKGEDCALSPLKPWNCPGRTRGGSHLAPNPGKIAILQPGWPPICRESPPSRKAAGPRQRQKGAQSVGPEMERGQRRCVCDKGEDGGRELQGQGSPLPSAASLLRPHPAVRRSAATHCRSPGGAGRRSCSPARCPEPCSHGCATCGWQVQPGSRPCGSRPGRR